MEYSQIIAERRVKLIEELSNKEDSAVLLVSQDACGAAGTDGTGGTGDASGEESEACAGFVMRIYRHEMRAYRLIEGRNIDGLPKVRRCYREQGYFIVEEEYIDGISLQEMIDGGERMEEERVIQVVSSICGTLSSLHALGIIHRDVKPEHLMVTPEGKIYLIDLDAAMQLAPEKKSDTRLLGTATYAAPEQFGLTRSDRRTDIFAVGILLNILLTGVHPTVKQYRSGDLAKIIAKCTEMNPAYRYQTADELIFDLKHAVLSEKRAKRRKLYKLAGSIAGVILLILGILIFDGIYYPKVEMKNFEPADSTCLVCTKESGNIYSPVKVSYIEEAGMEEPAQIFLGDNKNRCFYVLYRNNADKLELPILDSAREETGEKLAADAVKKGTSEMGEAEYYIWEVKVAEGFEGAARVGLSFDGTLAAYDFGNNEDTRKTKFLWVLDESFEEDVFLAEHDSNIIPCGENVSGEEYNSTGGLSTSEAVLGAEGNEPLVKDINMSLEPGDDENAFYLVHPTGTEVREDSYIVYAFGLDSSGYGGEGPGGHFREKIDEKIYDCQDAGKITIAGEPRQVTRVSLKQYKGHQDIETNFGLVNAESGSTVTGFAGVRLQMGLNIVIEAENEKLPNMDAIEINPTGYFVEKALGFEPETKPLKFVKNEDGNRYEAFLPKACSVISDEGQGRILDIGISLKKGSEITEITDITDIDGESIAYEKEDVAEYILLDENGDPVYDAGEIYARGWRYGMSGASVTGSENRTMIDSLPGNREEFEKFLRSKDRNGNPVKVRKSLEYTRYSLHFDREKDCKQNEIIFIDKQ